MAQPALQPWKVGVLVDIPETPGITSEFIEGVQLGLDLAHSAGRLDRPAEVIPKIVWGSPWASSHDLIGAYRGLADEGVLAVVGPMNTDNSLALLPVVEELRIPTISICGASAFAGEFAFSLPNGGLAEEAIIISSWLAAQGHRRIALLRERPSRVADEYHENLLLSVRDDGLDIVATEAVSAVATQDDVAAAIGNLAATNAEALVYLGFGSLFRYLNPALEAVAWDPVKMTNTVFVGAQCNRRFAQLLEGWYGIEQYDERNTVFAAGLAAWAERGANAATAVSSLGSCALDAGRCVAIALQRMSYPTPTQVRDALETIRRLPAATGAVGTSITFGYRDHRGFKGADYLVVRRAEAGATHWVGTAPVGN
jgi:ABC-type branched-subunit amino acid transport system substrate-binding protein